MGGKAYVIIPDGILGRIPGVKLRHHILRECYLDAVISLPTRTFFANFERTYILVLTKKHSADDIQQHPVFTYLVSHIGERLTSVEREEIEDNDLPDMERLFRSFVATRSDPPEAHPRCKIQPFSRFREEPHWVVDRWWTSDEKASLEDTGSKVATKAELDVAFADLQSAIDEYDQMVEPTDIPHQAVAQVSLGDNSVFETFIGKRVRKADVEPGGTIPIYSANVYKPFVYESTSLIPHFEVPTLLWGIDGNFEFNLIPAGVPFGTTDHCGALRTRDPDILLEYVLYALHQHRREENFSREFRAALTHMRRIAIPVPLTPDGSYDRARQRVLADEFTSIQDKAEKIEGRKAWLNEQLDAYLNANRWTRRA